MFPICCTTVLNEHGLLVIPMRPTWGLVQRSRTGKIAIRKPLAESWTNVPNHLEPIRYTEDKLSDITDEGLAQQLAATKMASIVNWPNSDLSHFALNSTGDDEAYVNQPNMQRSTSTYPSHSHRRRSRSRHGNRFKYLRRLAHSYPIDID